MDARIEAYARALPARATAAPSSLAPMRRSVALPFVALALAGALGACGASRRASGEGATAEASVESEGDWSASARARIEAVITEHGRSSASFDATRPPVAVLDWDNTTMRGDIGDLSFALALERGLLRVPAGGDFGALEPLTDAARAAFAAACAGTAAGAAIDPGSACARELAHVALGGHTVAGESAFVTPVTPTSRASYAFLGQLFTGMTREALGALGRDALAAAAARPLGSMLSPGGFEIEGFARIQPPVAALVARLREAGFSVWVVSASHQALVEAIASEAGVDPANVIGVRPRLGPDGRYALGWDDPTSEGDAPTALAAGTPPIITYYEGKCAWISRVIFGARGSAVLARPAGARRPVLALGDADTDLAMLESASALAILFDRHQVRVTCRALSEPARFVVHPLFVAPPPPRAEPYPCSTHVDALGPVLGPDGAPIADQPPP